VEVWAIWTSRGEEAMDYDLEPPPYIDEEQERRIQQNISKEVQRLRSDPRTSEAIKDINGFHQVVTGYRLYKRLRNVYGVKTFENACTTFISQHKGE
jgi:hypothetical protein